MTSKRIVFWISLLGTLFFVFLASLEFSNNCDFYNLCEKTYGMIHFIGFDMFLLPVVFFFSLITYKMRAEVYKSWFNFSCWYLIPFILFSIFLMNNTSGGGYIMSGGYFNALLLFFLLFIYFLISLILIISKHFSLKKINTST